MMLSRSQYEEVLEMRREVTLLRANLAQTAREYYARKYSPNQPRVPAGSREGGQWTDAGGDGGINDSRVISDAMPDNDWTPGAQYAAGPRRPKDGLPIHIPNNSERVGPVYRAGQVTIVNNAQTGLSTVDERTESLRTILEGVVNSRAEGSGSEYGTAIHTAFANEVRAANLRGIGRKGVEQTFGPDPDNPNVSYGTKGSVRTDVVLRNDIGDVIAIYDVKTGDAYLGPKRVKELREKTGASSTVPIIEMQIRRGLSLKAQTGQGHYVWIITLRLWNPWIRGIVHPGVDEGVL